MAIEWQKLQGSSRLLMEAGLRPIQGTRFQPTGFPDLGAATYEMPSSNGSLKQMLLVESAQSMANRLESVCWDEGAGSFHSSLNGIPYVNVKLWDSGQTTNSILEAHRLNSPYIMSDDDFKEEFRKKANVPVRGRVQKQSSGEDEESGGAGLFDRRKLAEAAFYFDPSSVLHGVFLEKLDGRARLQRCLSAFIEAANVERADSGGVKNDRVAQDPRSLGFAQGEGARLGFGNVPFHRTEFVADSITAYFNIDLGQLRAYGLGEAAERFLVALALWKVRRFLDAGLRLRTACDLEISGDLTVKRPQGFAVPQAAKLEAELQSLIQRCASEGLFASPSVTELTFQKK
ncbi:MAG: type I-U CRISPR-associated RAMP protein Csb1/Cas7u [Chloroflexi bacterium]|nr:type I-U CRISPR-associated RAMP protein Csb1/Cas7u [Chloroflexota bacterium]